MLGYLSLDIICSVKQTLFQEHSSRKTVSFEEQIRSKDKHASIFSKSNGGYCIIILQLFFTDKNLGNILGYFPVLAEIYSIT